MSMMHCVTIGEGNIFAQKVMESDKDISNLTYLSERLIRLIREIPSGYLTANALSAYTSFGASYRRDGLKGALVHAKWMISSLRKLPRNGANGQVLDTAEALAHALDLEW